MNLPFTEAEAEHAHDVWGCNCGPTALAAVTGLTLDQVRPKLGDFENRGYLNTRMMIDALRCTGKVFTAGAKRSDGLPVHGLALIRWHGPWMDPGVPYKVRFKYTHWVAGQVDAVGKCYRVFDVNNFDEGLEPWATSTEWKGVVVPALTEAIKGATGEYSITNAIEVERPKEG